jgi:hypothetical protein
MAGIVAHHFDFIPILFFWVEGENIVVVFSIHCQNQVEVGKVCFGELSGTSCHGDVFSGCCGLHSAIWGASTVIVASSGGVAVDALYGCFCNEMVHDVFGGWGTTDVAEADEEDFSHFDFGFWILDFGLL